jgi:7-cyano-7-deazaguanine tRNA-ribosyltransferase
MSFANFTTLRFEKGRVGFLSFGDEIFTTPLLFPVACLITGTTPRGGGIWKYILQAHPLGLMRRNNPIITQALHFLDFSMSRNAVERWRTKTLKDHYNQQFPDLHYHAPIFMDSGGFKLLWNSELDVSKFGLQATPEAILSLQHDLGSDMIATLDYPLPPGLKSSEAQQRMQKSHQNAMAALTLLKDMPTYNPFVLIAVHGQNGSDIRQYVELSFAQMEEYSLTNNPVGIAIGSLVPLRGANKISTIVEIVKGAVDGIPEKYRATTPVHIFGITGNLIPLLAYLGVDTFDSSSYVQMARTLRYFDPAVYRFRPVLEMDHLHCNCIVCRKLSLQELQDGLTAISQPPKPLENGVFKSKYYADIALHNLEMDYQIVRRTSQAIQSGCLTDYVIEYSEHFPHLRSALTALAKEDTCLNDKLSHVTFSIPTIDKSNSAERVVSLEYTPDSFNIVLNGYRPPLEKRILLIIPCSGGKPYSISRSHKLVTDRLSQAIGAKIALVHKVTLSGLYGPVPEEYENEVAVLNYDFRLDPANESQIELVSSRLKTYLERFGNHYVACIGYATSRSYRTAIEVAARQTNQLQVLPLKPKARRLTEFFRGENIEQLVNHVLDMLNRLEV